MKMEKLGTISKHRAHQELMLQMLNDIDQVCKEYHIHYMLFSGTALGAVRHHGFIPWDDDLDILMFRADYDRFLNIAQKVLDRDKYFVQKEFGLHWPMHFSKLRRNDTTCIEKFHPRDAQMHQGIYIDIFPCDNLADNNIIRRLQFIASKVVIAKTLYARGYETDSMMKKCFIHFCRLLPLTQFWRFCVRKKDISSQMVHTFFGCGSKYDKNIFPREWIEQTEDIVFEGKLLPVSSHYDELLTKLYGDYHHIPDYSERKCKEHAAIIDLTHPYTDYLEKQRAMKFETYTRSIR